MRVRVTASRPTSVCATAREAGFLTLLEYGSRAQSTGALCSSCLLNIGELKMRRYAKILMSLIVVSCCALTVYAQSVSEVAEKLKTVLREKAPCWKTFRQQERKSTEFVEAELDLMCGKESVIAYLYQAPSVEAAAKLLYEIRTSPVAAPATLPAGNSVDSYKFGDESYVSTYYHYSRSSYVYFRKGNIVVRIDSNMLAKPTSARTLRNAVWIAQLLADLIRPDSKWKPR